MKNIPTAEEFYKKVTGCIINHSDTKKALIEFTKLHVEEALKAALENFPCGSSSDTVSYEDAADAILNAYPLTNIK